MAGTGVNTTFTSPFTWTVLDKAKEIKTVQGSNGVWKAAGKKLGGKALGPAAVAVGEAIQDAPELVQSFKEKRGAQGVGSFVTKVGGTVGTTVAGTAVGAGIGTTIGAGIGGFVGALFAGVGAIPGAAAGVVVGKAVGGFVGGLTGCMGGSWLFGKVADGIFGKNTGDAEAKTESNKVSNEQVAVPSTKSEDVTSTPKPTTDINMPPITDTPLKEQPFKLEKGKTLGDLVLANKKELSEKYGKTQLWGDDGLVDKVAKENGFTGWQDERLKHLEVGHSFKFDA